jgi:hypothetical protein
VAPICTDTNDWPGVALAASALRDDVHSVTGKTPLLLGHPVPGSTPVIVGTIGRSAAIDSLIVAKKLDVTPIMGKWESFIIQVVANPSPGISQALVIAGSDKRGTIFGVYDLSEEIGVSPWHWWADVHARHHDNVYVQMGRYVQGPPVVKYRGIFINDELPSLGGWAGKNYGGFTSKFYVNVFELLLRLKANYLWPAMWGNSFSVNDPQNPVLADQYGIVMGTSHQEPMMRADHEIHTDISATGVYDYSQNRDAIYKFWKGGVDRVKGHENIYTIGMRGTSDKAIYAHPDKVISLLQQIVSDQRTILSETVNPDVTKIPQMWCLYKEVQQYYDEGLRVPDDVTLLWSDDNFGNIRRLPTATERNRSGGAGIYYHFDYVGGPRNYKWTSTVPLEKLWHQLNLAYNYDARQIWIVNVGSLKLKEFDISFFMDYAWDPSRWPKERLGDYATQWSAQQFGPKFAPQIANIVTGYLKLNGMRKPEQMSSQPYSDVNYGEAERISNKWQDLTDSAENIYAELPDAGKDAFYELVLYPAKASGNVAQLYFAAAKNKLYAKQGRASANDEADRVSALFKVDQDLTDYYNTRLAGGKWGPFMAQPHIGYTTWIDPKSNVVPDITRADVPANAGIGVTVDGSDVAWPGGDGHPDLPVFDRCNRQTYYITLFAKGKAAIAYTVAPSVPWILVDKVAGSVSKDQKIAVTIDWFKAPAGPSQGSVTIGSGIDTFSIAVAIDNSLLSTNLQAGTFIESQGYIAIEPEHWSANTPGATARWESIPNYGRTLCTVMPFPVNAASLTSTQGAPCITYNLFTKSAGAVKVTAIVSPSLDYVPGRGIRYAIAFDDQTPQIIDSLDGDASKGWTKSVVDNCRTSDSTHTTGKPGPHVLKVWMVDPGLALQKLVIDFGGVKPSYLGPPESYRVPNSMNQPSVLQRVSEETSKRGKR